VIKQRRKGDQKRERERWPKQEKEKRESALKNTRRSREKQDN